MKRHNHLIIALFLIPLFLLAAFNLAWPNQQVSADENRTLRQMPAFSLNSLLTGEYTVAFEDYFSDQFPLRQIFIGTRQQMLELIQAPLAGSISLVNRPEQDIGIGERIEPDPSDMIYLPTETTRKETEPVPEPTTEATAETQASQETAATQPTTAATTETAATETQVTAPTVEGKVQNYSAVIIVNDFAMEIFGFSKTRGTRYAGLVNQLQAHVPEARVFDMVAPTSIEFYSPERYHDLSSSQASAIQYINQNLNSGVISVDAYGRIAQHLDEYLYFRTDHHWTARGAYYAYQAFAERAGLQPVQLDALESGRIEGDFLGSLYRYTKSSALRNNPDFVEYHLPAVTSEGFAFSTTEMASGYKVKAVYTKTSSSNKYLVFIGGDNPLVHFKTSLTNGQSIVVLKESFGNALVPFLLNHYEDVYVIDPRSLKANLPDFIRQHQIQDVLIINYAFSVGSATWSAGFEAMIG